MNNQKTFFIIFYSVILGITVLLAIILFTQYRYFKREACELAQVKEAYYQHVDMLKRSLNASITSDEEDESDSQSEKKKLNQADSGSELSDAALEDIANNTKIDFQIISDDEEHQLRIIKSGIEKTVPSVTRKKRRMRKTIRNVIRPSTRYAPIRDFSFSWPIDLESFWLSSLFGPRKRPNGHVEFHHAIDMAAIKGTPIKAAASGKVIIAQTLSGYGNCVMIEHNHRYKTRYAHMHRIKVAHGQYVQQGQCIGTVGDTGLVRKSGRDASHLHFEIYQDGHRVNPLAFLFS